MVINETKLDSDRCGSEFQHSNFNMFRRDRASGKGGGIMVFVNKAYEIFDFHQNNTIESLNFSIKLGNKNVAFIAAYRPPHQENESIFFNTLEKKSTFRLFVIII